MHVLVVATILLVAFCALTAAGNLSETDDAYHFAYGAEHFPLTYLSDPRLMLYHVAVRGLSQASRAIGLDLRALPLMRAVSAVSAALCLVLLVRLMARHLALSPTAALAAAGLLGASYGFWRYAPAAPCTGVPPRARGVFGRGNASAHRPIV